MIWTKENQHPDYDFDSWQYEVANGDTEIGYHEWVEHMKEGNEEDFYEHTYQVTFLVKSSKFDSKIVPVNKIVLGLETKLHWLKHASEKDLRSEVNCRNRIAL